MKEKAKRKGTEHLNCC